MTELVRAVRVVLDGLPEEEEPEEAEDGAAAAAAVLPGKRDNQARIGEFTIEADLAGPRVWIVRVRRRADVHLHTRAALPGARRRAACGPIRLGPGSPNLPLRSWLPTRLAYRMLAVLDARFPPTLHPHLLPSLLPRRPLQGAAIERFAQMTDWGYYEAARRFQRVLVAAGIDSALTARGVMVGAEGGAAHGGEGRGGEGGPPMLPSPPPS